MTYNLPSVIFEVANFHAGNFDLLNKAISDHAKINYQNKHIKFQPFQYDLTALSDFPYYDLYTKLYFNNNQWAELIKNASELYNGVWIDINDAYSLQILQENSDRLCGIKIQASIVENYEVLQGLKQLDLKNKELMLNISGFDIEQIQKFVEKFSVLNFKKLILQAGFQNYPTQIVDTSLNKIAILKQNFSNLSICFADHVDGSHAFAQIVPSQAVALGANYIEKHICIDRKTTEYDAYSALEFSEMQNTADNIKNTVSAVGTEFICASEIDYLNKSIQKPILGKDGLKAGQFIAESDILYRRTGQEGLNIRQIEEKQKQGYILKTDKNYKETIQESDFKKAKIGVIVACRLKSIRLPNKASLLIDDLPMIEHCLNSCKKFPVDVVVLATSDNQQDAALEKHAKACNVPFFAGDADDVVKRYLDVCQQHDLDMIFRMTGDNPFPSFEIAEYMLQSHLESGADYTYPTTITVGVTTEIYNVQVLKKIAENVNGACDLSEYMNWYVISNPEHFKINTMELPQTLFRPDYRLTVDYPEDIEFAKKLVQSLENDNKELNLHNIFSVLDTSPDIVASNAQMNIVYKTDPNLLDTLARGTKFKKAS